VVDDDGRHREDTAWDGVVSRNTEVARRLEELADFHEAAGDEYKPTTYRRAASNVREYPDAIEDLAAEGEDAVQEIEGVGEAISAKIVEYLETGSITKLEAYREEFPVAMAELTAVEGIGPKTVAKLYEALGIQDLDDLQAAAEAHEIRAVKGFGEKTEQNIRDHIDFAREAQARQRLGDARPIGEDVVAFLESVDAVDVVELAGSTRRWRPTIGDIDVLVGSESGAAIGEALSAWERTTDVIETGETKTSIRLDALRIDLRVVDPTEFGAALQYFTGSKAHNVRLRNHAIDQGKKINEYGVFDVSDVEDPQSGQRVGERLASEAEADVYAALDCEWIPPELREDRGEVAAALAGDLPALVELDDVRGDLHTHTEWSDGHETIASMLEGAAAFGHDYVCISDHAEGPGVFGDNGLSDEEIREQMVAVEAAAEEADVEVFHGIEANVAADGGIGDISEDVMADLDLVIASPHASLGTDAGDQTDRLVAAAEHELVDILGHPSGRLINERPAMEYDPTEVAVAAADADTALEVNANPARLDLWGADVKASVEAGATIVIDTDAHSTAEYALVEYGVHTARRGWAEPADVLNARDADGVRDFLH
jgi:DNA polymerase (family 10)